MKILTIIPARKESVRLPNKNILPLANCNLVERTIICAILAGMKKIVFTTDIEKLFDQVDEKYPEVEVLLRPPILATSEATSESVAIHICNLFPEYDTILFLQPTSPLRTQSDIIRAIDLFKRYKLSALSSVDPQYKANGSIYLIKKRVLLSENSFWPKNIGIMVMLNRKSVNIDYLHEFRIAEAILNNKVYE